MGKQISSTFVPARRRGRTILAVLTYMVLSGAMILGVWLYYLVPALSAFTTATPDGRKRLGAYALLLMVVMLLLVGFLLVVTFRVSRFFFPRPRSPRTRTSYIDAWEESGRRLQTPPPDEKDEGEQT